MITKLVVLGVMLLVAATAAESQQIVCSSDDAWPDPKSTFICYWAEKEDDEFHFNVNGLPVSELVKLRWCPRAPTRKERLPSAAADKYWATCQAVLPVDDSAENCTKGCLATYCSNCDDGQTLYQVYGARLCLAARRCKNTHVNLNIPSSRVNEVQCAVRVLNDVSDAVFPGKVCLPWKDECAGDWYDCIANSDLVEDGVRIAEDSVISDSQQIVCSSDDVWPDPKSTFICYWAEKEDDEFHFNVNGLPVAELVKLRWCPHAPTRKERLPGAAADKYWATCQALLPVDNSAENCTKECLATYCSNCDDGQTLYQVYGARLCLAARKCKNTHVNLNIPNSRVNEVQCAVRVLNDVSDAVFPGKVCLPWRDECAGDWYDCIANSVSAPRAWSAILV